MELTKLYRITVEVEADGLKDLGDIFYNVIASLRIYKGHATIKNPVLIIEEQKKGQK